VKFLNACGGTTSAGPSNVMVYNNYVGTILTPTVNGGCVQTSTGQLNHFEIQLSQTQISIYGSDFSSDNATFPNYKLLYQADISLPFSRGYVHVAARNHATFKYAGVLDAIYHWDNIGFDGPIIPALRSYEIPDNTTVSTFTGDAGDPSPQPAKNLGYQLQDGQIKPAGMYDPVNLIPSLSFQNVNLSGAASAQLTFNAWFNASTVYNDTYHLPTTSWGISYSLNGGPFTTVNLTAAQIAAMGNSGTGYQGFWTPVINVPLSALVQGTNTIKFLPVGAPMDYAPVIANIDLLLNSYPAGGGSSTAAHDFNGDGKSDVAWRDTNGNVAIWLMNGTQILNPTSALVANVPYPQWTIIGTGDFNGDGYADLLWRDNTGIVAIWEMNGTQILNPTSAVVVNAGSWSVVGVGDFNGDTRSDILLTDGNSNYAIWEMNGTQIVNAANAYLAKVIGWSVVGVGDFNGDGRSDILWTDGSGNYAIWEMNGTQILNPTSAYFTQVTTNWKVVGIADFNGDGRSDILWEDQSSNYAIWEMNGLQITNPTSALVTNASGWTVVGTGDYNGDGMSDILLTNGNGDYALWEMNGTQIINPANAYLAKVSTNWAIQLPLGQ
jgi:FG-GAP-like repeat